MRKLSTVDIRARLARFRRDDRGSSTVEYAIVVLVAAAIALVLLAFVNSQFFQNELVSIVKDALEVKL